MAASKTALKAVKAAIDAGDFEKAATNARLLVQEDSKNYNALMFLGFAAEKLGHYPDAEKALQSALAIKGQDMQACKGLVTLYEKQGPSKLDQYHNIAHQLAKSYADLDDSAQCQNVIDKYELFAKKHGSGQQYRRALELMLPSSDLYNALEGRVPHPSQLYQRILDSVEVEEQAWISSQINDRRTRLGARIDQVTREVKYEAISEFRVEEKYEALIDWTTNDEIRHELEEKLLQRLYENLGVVPYDMKASQRDKVLTTANGMVIIKHQFQLAWSIALEWVDAEDIADWDVQILREFVEFFPDDGLAEVLKGFLDSRVSPFPKIATSSEGEEVEPLTEADQLILMVKGLEESGNSMLAHRIMAHTYLKLEEYQSSTEMARKARKLQLSAEADFGLDLQNSIDAVNITLANALITFQSPRHHPEAKAIFQEILSRKPTLTAALLGIGLIYEEDEDYCEATRFLRQALDRDPANIRIQLEHAWCDALDNDLEAGLSQLKQVLAFLESQTPQNFEMKAEALYRVAYCMWNIDTSSVSRKDKSGAYRYLIDSVKADPSYAPAYTLLGIYFQDYGKSKQRARVALQKAFELSTSEIVAAERLANIFAKSGEWDLVELVAQRVVESGKAKPAPGSKKKAFSWPYAALGVVQMNRQQYSQSVVSFQAALRISPLDYHSWVGLGESYHNSGRYIAAARAFNKAESIDHGLPLDHTWFAKYMLANVQREVGAFNGAISAYEAVLEIKKDEFGVLLALLQTCAESASAQLMRGLFGQAVQLGNKAVQIAQQIAHQRTDVFNLWKSAADACSVIAQVKTFAAESTVDQVRTLLQTQLAEDTLEVLSEVDNVGIETLQDNQIAASDKCLLATVLTCKRAIHASAHDLHAQAVAWYNLGHAEHRVYTSASPVLLMNNKKPTRFLKAAIRCFKRAIELEAGNSEYWNALGLVTMHLSPKISQHSFVRSLHLNSHSAKTWTNLGVLYLLHNDAELANEAFTRAQSTDPDFAAAWIGQGLLAMMYNKAKEARGLFVHAFEIAESSSIPAGRHFATSAFDNLTENQAISEDIVSIVQPLFALRQIHAQRPFDIAMSHLLSLFAERVGEFDDASNLLQEVCDFAESEYEKSESSEYLARYAQAKADLARIQLGLGGYQAALENAVTALDLSEESGPAHADRRQKWQLSAHIVAGLAHDRLKSTDQSVKMLHAALEESDHAPDVVCLLAQVLWANGGQAERNAARAQLFACVENHPDHIRSIILLAIIGLIDNDEDILGVVEDDLRATRTSDMPTTAEKLNITKVLTGLLEVRGGGAADHEEVIADALQCIMLSPAQPQGWLELAKSHDDTYAAKMALTNATYQIPPRGTLTAEELSSAYSGTGAIDDNQVSLMLAPWSADASDMFET